MDQCPIVRPIEGEISTLDDARRAFRGRPRLEFDQAWLLERQVCFARGSVRLGLVGMAVAAYAEFSDRDVFNPVQRFNVAAFPHGDVFECFIKPESQAAYFEFHVTPDNHLLQLRFPKPARELVTPADWNSPTDPLLPFKISRWRVRSLASRRTGGWHAYLEIPLRRIYEDDVPWDGARLQISFARYDYTRGRLEPVLSSTSPHAALNFHRISEWETFALQFR